MALAVATEVIPSFDICGVTRQGERNVGTRKLVGRRERTGERRREGVCVSKV